MKLLWLLFFAVLLAGCASKGKKEELSALPYYHTPDFTPVWLSEKTDSDTLHTLAPFSFTNQNSVAITSDQLKGKIHVADFFFTFCPGLCPRLTQSMKEVQAAFKDDAEVKLLSYSVMPERDSVAVLRRYADEHRISGKQWHLLTGEKKAIYETARRSYFADENLGVQKRENDFLHTENFILVDKNLRIRGIYNGTLPLEIKQLIEDIKTLKQED
ncbi:MAG: SCO family protein [Spirosomataceae bacterium]